MKKKISITLEEKILKKIKKTAKANHTSVSAEISKAILNELKGGLNNE